MGLLAQDVEDHPPRQVALDHEMRGDQRGDQEDHQQDQQADEPAFHG